MKTFQKRKKFPIHKFISPDEAGTIVFVKPSSVLCDAGQDMTSYDLSGRSCFRKGPQVINIQNQVKWKLSTKWKSSET